MGVVGPPMRTVLMPGINTVRMGGPTTPMTKDYRLDRATGLIENGVVTRITCG